MRRPFSGLAQGRRRPKNRTNLRFPLYQATEGIEQLDEQYLHHVFETALSWEVCLNDTSIWILVIILVLRPKHVVPNREDEAIILIPVFLLDGMMNAMRLRCDQNVFQGTKVCPDICVIQTKIEDGGKIEPAMVCKRHAEYVQRDNHHRSGE